MSQKAVRVFIKGKVQGVWFRATTKQQAEQLGIHGWVRNMKDGRVEALFEGASDKVDEMIEWCYQGSPMANVRNVTVKELDKLVGYSDFQIKR